MDDLQQYARSMASGARQAALQLAESTGDQRNAWLLRVAELLATERESLSEANRQDIERAPEQVHRHRVAPVPALENELFLI